MKLGGYTIHVAPATTYRIRYEDEHVRFYLDVLYAGTFQYSTIVPRRIARSFINWLVYGIENWRGLSRCKGLRETYNDISCHLLAEDLALVLLTERGKESLLANLPTDALPGNQDCSTWHFLPIQ